MDKIQINTLFVNKSKSYKKILFLALFGSMLFFSCNHKTNSTTEDVVKANRISIIIDDQLWNSEIGDTIRNKFAAPVIGLPQEEPLFTINQYPVKLFEGYMTNSRNIIIIKKESKSRFEIIENEYVTPQNVIHISGKTTAEILDTLQSKSAEIIKSIKQSEITEIQKINRKALLNSKKIKKKFKINLQVPKTYKYVFEGRKFLWLKKEIISGSMSLLIYQVPIRYLKKNGNSVKNIVRMRDSIGNLYIHGTIARTKMATENSYSPYLTKINMRGNETFETKGTWEMKNDFMSGPFINYGIVDSSRNRILVIEGFCYAPSKEKRDLMFELEAIIKSVTIPKRKKYGIKLGS